MFEDCERPAGPFPSVKDFNDYLMEELWIGERPHPMRPGVPDDIPIMFTHADLTPSNVIVSSSASGPHTILAIVDWHQSGWYPAYWEACKSISNADPNSEWGQGLPFVLRPYNECLSVYSYMISVGIGI